MNPEIKRWKALVKLDVNEAAGELIRKSPEEIHEVTESLGEEYISGFVSRLATDTASAVLRVLSGELRDQVLHAQSDEKQKDLREILTYPSGTAGSMMAKEYLAVPVEIDLADAIQRLRKINPERKGKISYIYAVDRTQRLEGVIQARDLVFYPPEKPVREILKSPVVQVEAGMSHEDVARLLQRHRYLGLPVVDKMQKLVGVISADVVMDAMEQNATDDIAKIVGTSAEEMKTHSVRRIVRLRLPWLAVNLLSGMACAYISGVFQNEAPKIAVLFLFVPVILGLSESTGVQGATILVRNISLGNISFRYISSLFLRESLAGILIGVACGISVGFFAWLWMGKYVLGIALAVSMTFAIIISALIGLLLPLMFQKIKFDPALASGPFVLAVCDIQTLLVYFSLSGIVLNRFS